MVWPDAASFSSSSVGDALPCVLYERRCGGAAAVSALWCVVAVLAAALCPRLAASVTVFVVIRAASTTTAVGVAAAAGGGGSTKAEPFPSSFLYSKAESIFYTSRDDEKRKPLVRATYSISKLRKR